MFINKNKPGAIMNNLQSCAHNQLYTVQLLNDKIKLTPVPIELIFSAYLRVNVSRKYETRLFLKISSEITVLIMQ